MQLKTRQMELTKALDEVFLRLALLALRIIETLITIPLIGLTAALINDFSTIDDFNVPDKATAALAVACVCAMYILVSFLPILFEGVRFFTTLTILDCLLTGGWIALAAVWSCDGQNSCAAYQRKYFGSVQNMKQANTDCKIVKATYALLIINLILFVGSAIVNFCLRSLELKHTTSWRHLPLAKDYVDHRRRQCQCHCHEQPKHGAHNNGTHKV